MLMKQIILIAAAAALLGAAPAGADAEPILCQGIAHMNAAFGTGAQASIHGALDTGFPKSIGADLLAAQVSPFRLAFASLVSETDGEERATPVFEPGRHPRVFTPRFPSFFSAAGPGSADDEFPLRLAEGVSIAFWNPYFLRFCMRSDAETGLNTDTTEEISLGINGDISSIFSAVFYSTLSMGRSSYSQYAGASGYVHESALHRFVFGIGFAFQEGLVLGIGAGARFAGRSWDGDPEFYVALRLKI